MVLDDLILMLEQYFPAVYHEAYNIINIGTRSEYAVRECPSRIRKSRRVNLCYPSTASGTVIIASNFQII